MRIGVEDDGPGIADNVLPRLFHSFVTTKGTSLGLRICRCIVEEMGGSITAGNRPQGGGSAGRGFASVAGEQQRRSRDDLRYLQWDSAGREALSNSVFRIAASVIGQRGTHTVRAR